MKLSDEAILEIHELSGRAERLARGSAADRKQADVLLQRINSIRSLGLSSDEMRRRYAGALDASLNPSRDEMQYAKEFSNYLAGAAEPKIERRDFLAGQEKISWTAGLEGGFAIPVQFDPVVKEAMAQTDPVLSEEVAGFTMTPGVVLQPQQVSGWDLSTTAAAIVGETLQQTAGVIPTVRGGVLRNNLTFRISFGASLEAEEDIQDFGSKVVRAASVSLARGIGRRALIGTGGTYDLPGLVANLLPGLSNQTAGKLQWTDILNLFFSVNVFYRNSPKAGWLLSDNTYKLVRAMADNNDRPLISATKDEPELLDRPIYISPSLDDPFSSLGVQGPMVFGDLSSLIIRCARPSLQRSLESGITDITKGEILYIARCRADSLYFDPSGGSNPPLAAMIVN